MGEVRGLGPLELDSEAINVGGLDGVRGRSISPKSSSPDLTLPALRDGEAGILGSLIFLRAGL